MKFTYFLAASVALATVACDKDDEPVTQADIVGSWELSEYDASTELDAQGTLTTSTTSLGDDYDAVIEFRDDNTYRQTGSVELATEVVVNSETYPPVTQTYDVTGTGTYEVNDGRLTGVVLSYEGEGQVIDGDDAGYDLALDGDRLIMTTALEIPTVNEIATEASLRLVYVRQ